MIKIGIFLCVLGGLCGYTRFGFGLSQRLIVNGRVEKDILSPFG